MTCCDLHTEPECCDPDDCGPCCGICPTCPSLGTAWLYRLTAAERATFATTAATRAQMEDDPRYWTGHYLDEHGRYGCRDHAARLRSQRRWARLAAILDPDQYHDLPARIRQRQEAAS
jgi:hypothetical protein